MNRWVVGHAGSCRSLKVGAVEALSSRSRPRGRQPRVPCPPTGQDWRPLLVAAGEAGTTSGWQSRARALRSMHTLAPVQPPPGWRLELRRPTAATGFAFFTPRKAAADGWRYVLHTVRKTYQSGPCSLQKTYSEKASVVKSPHKGTRCAHHGGWLDSSLWLHCLFSTTVAPAGFGEGPSVQGCGHPGPKNRRPATGCPSLQLAVPPLSAVPGTCPSRSLANNCVPEGRGRV